MVQLYSSNDVTEKIPAEEITFLVPTMGALHRGHLDLIERARHCAYELGDHAKVVVSIFVNPIQFDRAVDLDSYPRTLEKDLDLCESAGVDYVFTPDSEEFYANDRSITVSENSLSNLLCGATRPGHFDGVCTVIAKLLNIFQPAAAIFGEKDYQQLAIIRRLCRDLNFRTEIIGHRTVRELSGLAMSSRNLKLSEEAMEQAPQIRAGMLLAQESFHSGNKSSDHLLSKIRLTLDQYAPMSKIDYLQCVCAETLQTIQQVDRPAVIAIAVFFDNVRLIDNIILDPARA